MSQVNKSSLHDFVNGETVTETMLDQNFEVLRAQGNDTDARVTDVAGVGRTTETVKGNADSMTAHKTSGDHDARYFTQTQSDANYYRKSTVDTISSDLATHKANTSNPHSTTAAQVGAIDANDTRIHASSVLGTKTLDEALIGDGKVLMYDATSGKIKYQSVPGLSGQTVVADGTIQTNLNADMVDNRHAGLAAGNIPYLNNNAQLGASLLSGASVSDTLLTTALATTILQFTPLAQGNFNVMLYFRVVTGTTNVTVSITYDDGTGAQTNTLYSAQACTVGSYSAIPVFINAKVTNPIKIIVTASVANQVYASASIREV